MTGNIERTPLAVTAEKLADMLAVPGCYPITASRPQSHGNARKIARKIQYNSQRKNIGDNSQ